jgi:Protein of unknown function (DUF995)
MMKRFMIVFAAILLLAGCQTAKDVLAKSGATQLTKAEAVALLSGKTYAFSSGKGAGYYLPNGKFEYVWKGQYGTGNWKVTEEGTYCLKVEVWWGKEFKCLATFFHEDNDITIYDLRKKKFLKNQKKSYIEGNSIKDYE